ncbi:hypothetical protein [Mesorhizobium opportunistum]
MKTVAKPARFQCFDTVHRIGRNDDAAGGLEDFRPAIDDRLEAA